MSSYTQKKTKIKGHEEKTKRNTMMDESKKQLKKRRFFFMVPYGTVHSENNARALGVICMYHAVVL
jgi:hypothetical protein